VVSCVGVDPGRPSIHIGGFWYGSPFHPPLSAQLTIFLDVHLSQDRRSFFATRPVAMGGCGCGGCDTGVRLSGRVIRGRTDD